MGRMIQIDDFIKELQETRRKFGNTCVYIRDVSWGGVALNREAEDQAAEHIVAGDGADGLPPQWICMTCKTVIGPIVDDDEHRCNCRDEYDLELWRVAPVVEKPRP